VTKAIAPAVWADARDHGESERQPPRRQGWYQRAVGAPDTEAFDGFNANTRDGVVTDWRSGRT
jgi:hypothetical protein